MLLIPGIKSGTGNLLGKWPLHAWQWKLFLDLDYLLLLIYAWMSAESSSFRGHILGLLSSEAHFIVAVAWGIAEPQPCVSRPRTTFTSSIIRNPTTIDRTSSFLYKCRPALCSLKVWVGDPLFFENIQNSDFRILSQASPSAYHGIVFHSPLSQSGPLKSSKGRVNS